MELSREDAKRAYELFWRFRIFGVVSQSKYMIDS